MDLEFYVRVRTCEKRVTGKQPLVTCGVRRSIMGGGNLRYPISHLLTLVGSKHWFTSSNSKPDIRY